MMMGTNLFDASKLGRATAALAGAALLATASFDASAAFKVRLTDNLGNTVTVEDDMAGDNNNPQPGVINFNGSLGGTTVWTVNVTTGISKPVLGSPSEARMDLNSVNVSSTGAGTLTIELTDTDFTALGKLTGGIGGTTNGTVSAAAYIDAGNNEFDTSGTMLAVIAGAGPGVFSASSSTGGPPGTPYSLTQVVTIAHTDSGQITSFDFELVRTPEPGMLGVAGLGLAVAGLAGLRRRRSASA